jgi:HK97 family phage major capsid protein
MATYESLISDWENKRKDAERRVTDAKGMAKRYMSALDTAGLEKLTPEQERMVESLSGKHRDAIAEVRQAEGALSALRDAQAEDSAADELQRQVRDTGVRPPGGDGISRIGSGAVSVAPVASDGPSWRTDAGQIAALARGQSFGDHAAVRDHTERMNERDRHVIGEYGSLGHMVRALSTTGASAVIPQVWSNQIIDLARSKAAVLQAGAQVVPMTQKVTNMGRLTADPTAAFRAEGSSLGPSDPTFDSVTLTAKTLSAQVVMSLEFVQDSVNGEEVVTNALAQAMGLKLDFVALYGGLLTADCTGFELYTTDANNPTGILKTLLASASGQVLGQATNGTQITAASPWNEILDTIYQIKNQNLEPNAILYNTKMAQKLAKTYLSTYEPLPKPDDVQALQQFQTNQISSYTRGTMSNVATNVFVGKFDELIVGQRMALELRVLNERYAELGQVSVVALWRGDVAVAHPLAFSVYRSLGGA